MGWIPAHAAMYCGNSVFNCVNVAVSKKGKAASSSTVDLVLHFRLCTAAVEQQELHEDNAFILSSEILHSACAVYSVARHPVDRTVFLVCDLLSIIFPCKA